MTTVRETLSAPVNGEEPRIRRFLARQPICDRKREVVGYELLFRAGWEEQFSGEREENTRQLLDNLMVVGPEWLSSKTLVFLRCTREALLGGLVTLLPARHVVLEVHDTIADDEQMVSTCTVLKERGFRLALNERCLGGGASSLLPLADYIKIDFQNCVASRRKRLRTMLQGSTATLIAKKVETEAEFDRALNEDFDLFQGFFFCRPTMLPRIEARGSQLNHMRLLAALGSTPLNLDEVEALVMSDAALCFRLLRVANSPVLGLRGAVRSVRRALLVLGDDDFRRLVTIAMAGVLSQKRPHSLLCLSLQRARLCELLAPPLQQNAGEQYLLGLFSLMDAILETPMKAIVEMLPLRDPVQAALLGEQNFTALPLLIARSYESGDWAAAEESSDIQALGAERINAMCLEAARWASQALLA